MKKLILLLLPTLVSLTAFAQIDAGLFRYPDVSKTDIVFTYANDLWTIPKTGGTAVKLSSPAGVEVFPKFSPMANAWPSPAITMAMRMHM
jgi:tricorn protease